LWRDASSPDVSYALFAQQERDLSSRWKLYLGIRLDDSRNNASFLSPRVALVYRPTPEVAYKLLYGRSFRNPSAFERFYEPSPLVGPEKVNTFEFGREQRLRGRLILTTSAYHYLLRGLIEGVLVRDGTFRYENTSKTQATGVEVELAGRPIEHLEASASVSVQKASNRSAGTEMANSPRTLAQFRLGAPLFHDRLDLATSIRYFSARETMYSSSVGPVGLVDLTVNAYRLGGSFDLQFGIRNLGNRTYFDPMSTEHLPHILPRAGRTAYIKLIWLSRE
jgi:iron complex outermembrane receptor protein